MDGFSFALGFFAGSWITTLATLLYIVHKMGLTMKKLKEMLTLAEELEEAEEE